MAYVNLFDVWQKKPNWDSWSVLTWAAQVRTERWWGFKGTVGGWIDEIFYDTNRFWSLMIPKNSLTGMFFDKTIGSLMTSLQTLKHVLVGGIFLIFKVRIIQFRRRTPWWGLCDTVHWKVWCLPGHNCLHPSSSCGRPGGGGGKRHKGIQPLHKLLQLERARNWIKISFGPTLSKKLIHPKSLCPMRNLDLPANTSVRSHRFSEVTSSACPLSYILLPRPSLYTISFSMISYRLSLALDVVRSHLSRLLSPSVSLGAMMSVLNLVVSKGDMLLGVNLSAAGPTVTTWKNTCIGSQHAEVGSNALLAVSAKILHHLRTKPLVLVPAQYQQVLFKGKWIYITSSFLLSDSFGMVDRCCLSANVDADLSGELVVVCFGSGTVSLETVFLGMCNFTNLSSR